MLALRRFEWLFLDVFGEDDYRGAATGDGKADRPVDDVRQLGRGHDFLDIFRNVLEDPVEIDLLLIACAANIGFRLAADRKNRHMVELGVVKAGKQRWPVAPVHQLQEADTKLARENLASAVAMNAATFPHGEPG